MKIRQFLILMVLTFTSLAAYAQNGGVTGKVISRDNREVLSNVKVTVDGLGLKTVTDAKGVFTFENIPAGTYLLLFEANGYEAANVNVRIENILRDIHEISMFPIEESVIDDSIFAEFDGDTESDGMASPSVLSSSKDVFNNIASYRFSEMRFNVRGYESQYQSIYLNGIKFNDALTGYGPWSLWSGLNDATRNQENTAGLESSDFGIDGIAGTTNVNARASQMRKGFRASLVNASQMYRFRAMVSYASGLLDNGWSYAFSASTRQGGNGYVDGVYYNAYGYFASVEKLFGARRQHDLALTFMGAPTERGAQQASTQEAYNLLQDNYYNPNVGLQNGKKRNTRVKSYHEPILMLNYGYDITDNTKLTAAASFRFGQNGYSALTWMDGPDPRPDYYRYLPSFYENRLYGVADPGQWDEIGKEAYEDMALALKKEWIFDPNKSRIDFDGMYDVNRNLAQNGQSANYMIEERHTDQRDFNFAANIQHVFRDQSRLKGGINARINRTEYFNEVKDLLGGNYWLDIDKFALRDNGHDDIVRQNDLDYYLAHGEARKAKVGDKVGYDYYAHVRKANVWLTYHKAIGNFDFTVGGEVGFTNMWREGIWEKGLFKGNSKGNSEKLNFLSYKGKLELNYTIAGGHRLSLNGLYMQDAPTFRNAFVSARTRNTVTPGLKEEKVYGGELTYSLNKPWMKARLSGYYTKFKDQTNVISYYDDKNSSFTNFAMSGIDKRYYGLELGLDIPLVAELSLRGALSLGNYTYTSNPDFVQTVDNSEYVLTNDKVLWKGFYVEKSPQTAVNLGLNWRAPHNWFLTVDANYYDRLYLSMNPSRRTSSTYETILRPDTPEMQLPGNIKFTALQAIRSQEELDDAFTLSASIGKTWYIARSGSLGFSLEVKNILNNQDIRTGGYEQMRLSSRTFVNEENKPVKYYMPFDSKYFYMLGTTYYLNIYYRF